MSVFQLMRASTDLATDGLSACSVVKTLAQLLSGPRDDGTTRPETEDGACPIARASVEIQQTQFIGMSRQLDHNT